MNRKPPGSFNIHALLFGILALTLITGTARWLTLSGSTVTGKTRLAFWNGFTGPDGIVMLQIIDDFNRQNPDTEVVMQRIPWATYYNKLTVAGADGRGPEIFVVHADAIPRIRRAGFIANVTDLYSPTGVDVNDFDPYVIEQMKFGEDFVGVPLDVHPQGLYCNAEMLIAAGYTNPDGTARPPTNKSEFLDLITKTTIEPNPNLPEKQWGFAFTYWGANFRSLVPQFGGRYLDEQGNPVINSPENLEALEFLSEIAKQKLAPPADNGLGWFGYRTKRVAMVWDGIFMLGDLMRLDDMKYVGAPIPQIGPKPGTLANSHVLCLNKNLTPTERKAADKFIKFLSDNSIQWAAAGQVPARKSIRQTPEFQALPVQSAFAKQIPYVLYPPRTPTIFEFMLEVDLAVERVVRGQSEPKAALDTANKNCQAIIDRDRKDNPEGATSQ